MNKKGFSTLELLIASTVLMLVLFAVVLLSSSSQSLLLDSQNGNDALDRAQFIIENAKNSAKIDFDSVVDTTITDDKYPIFTDNLTVTELDAVTKKLSVKVTWQNGHKQVDLYSIITNLSDGPGADTCSFILSGNWKSPTNPPDYSNRFSMADLVGDSSKIYTVTDMDAYLGRLYVTTQKTTANQKDFFIFNLTNSASYPSVNPMHPELLPNGSKNDNANSTLGLNAVRVSEGYAYAASASTDTQLKIFNLNVNPPVVVKNFQVASVAGTSIFYKEPYVYLGLANNEGGPELYIIDVSDPNNPQIAGTAEIGGDVNSIYVKSTYDNNVKKSFTYVANSSSQNLQIFDVSNSNLSTTSPPALSPISEYSGSGTNAGKRVSVIGDTVYLSRASGTGTDVFSALNSPYPHTSISEKGILSLGAGTGVNGMAIRNNLAFLATDSGLFNIYDISKLPSNTPYNTNPVSLGNSASALDCEGNYVYVASNDSSGHGYITAITSSSN